jgi:hypothetical protein
MTSLIFLIIHPSLYPIICGGKGKARKVNGKDFGDFSGSHKPTDFSE